jgi:hypothetical protein
MFWRIFTESLALILAILVVGVWLSRLAGRFFHKDQG